MADAPRKEWLILDPNGRSYWRERGHGYSDVLGAGLFEEAEADRIVALGRGDRKVHVSDRRVIVTLEHARKGLGYFDSARGVNTLPIPDLAMWVQMDGAFGAVRAQVLAACGPDVLGALDAAVLSMLERERREGVGVRATNADRMRADTLADD